MKYELWVWCRRRGMSCDAGHHSSFECDNDHEAIQELVRQAREDLLFGYDEVGCTIKVNGKKIHSETIYKSSGNINDMTIYGDLDRLFR